jgi:hypothetical protein
MSRDRRHEAEQILRAQRHGPELLKLLRRLPPDVDPQLASRAALTLIHGSIASSGCWSFGRNCQQLPATVIRRLLEALTVRARDATGTDRDSRDSAIFVSALVDPQLDDQALEQRWLLALQSLLDLNMSYGWGSKQRKAKLTALASNPDVVAAAQAVAVGCEDASLDVLAVLCAEGSESSFDALMPHLQRAEESGERLEWLLRLRTHADTESAPIQSFLTTVEACLERLSGESGAIELAAYLGFGRPQVFWFDAYLGSTTLLMPNNVPLYQGHISVDSRQPNWFSLSLSRLGNTHGMPRTAFGRRSECDELGLGSCDAAGLPAWLAEVARKLETEWTVNFSSSLRGKKRQALERWLLGED